jgi:ABC-type branched-subunit amino acid transport system substrate-binding protein
LNLTLNNLSKKYSVAKFLSPFYFLLFPPLLACSPKTAPADTRSKQTSKPSAQRPQQNVPMDTVRWTLPANPKPPIGAQPTQPARPSGMSDTYKIGLLLPFLTNQTAGNSVPERSSLALQFYAGAQIALQEISETEGINLVVDVYDTQANDADFLQLISNPRLSKADVFIGPVRSTHVEAFAKWTKENRKILISPETPSSDLTTQNPDFLQTNPSLRAHCEAITRYVLKNHRPDVVTLICKEKEADRLPYFQNANAGSAAFSELKVPDATANFDKIDLKKYLKTGRTSVFILPTWASQDFVMAFLRKLKEVKGSAKVEVYGMPQWKNYESIEPEYLADLNVHVSSASYIDYSAQEVKDFQQKFYEATGTIPNDDAFNGYDVTLFAGKMLRRHGLSFPQNLDREAFQGLHGQFRFSEIFNSGNLDDGRNQPDYLENTFVHILKFEKYGFVPAP